MSVYCITSAEFDAYRQTVLNKEGLLNTLDVLEKPISTEHTYIDLKCWYTAGISRFFSHQ